MIISSSILNGFQQKISNKITGFAGNIQLSKIQDNYIFNKPIEVNHKMTEDIKSIKNIKSINHFAYKTGIIKNQNIQGIIMKGVDNNYNFDFFKKNITKGNIINFESKNEIIISEYISNKINCKVNEYVLISFIDEVPRIKKFKITGIYKTNLEEIDKNFIITNIQTIQNINKWNSNQIAGFEIKIKNLKLEKETINEIESIIPFNMHAKSIKTVYPQIFDWLKIQDYNFLIIMILMSIICIANIINCILIIAIDKIKFIGIIKTFGYNNKMINKIFFNISKNIITKGIIIGNIAGITICYLQKTTSFIKLNPEVYYMDAIPIGINLSQVFAINFVAIIFSLLSIFASSTIMTKLKTIKLINFE